MTNHKAPTIGPVECEVGPGPVHQLRGVVGVEGGVVEPAHRLHRHGEPAVEEQARLVPECQGGARVEGRLVDQVQGQVVLGEAGFPAYPVGHVEHCHVYREQSICNVSVLPFLTIHVDFNSAYVVVICNRKSV